MINFSNHAESGRPRKKFWEQIFFSLIMPLPSKELPAKFHGYRLDFVSTQCFISFIVRHFSPYPDKTRLFIITRMWIFIYTRDQDTMLQFQKYYTNSTKSKFWKIKTKHGVRFYSCVIVNRTKHSSEREKARWNIDAIEYYQ